MTLSWNVKDTQVFDELANGLRETEWMIQDIYTEANRVLIKTISNASHAASEMRARISALETEIDDLKRKASDMRRRGERTDAVELDIRKKSDELRNRREDLERLQKLGEDVADSKRSYDKTYDNSAQTYKDNITKTCKILNKFGILLTQSRMANSH